MHDLNKLLEECKKELDALSIHYGNVLEIIPWHNVRTWGKCIKLPDRASYRIKINAVLLSDDVPVEGAKNTVMHELLHTCHGCLNHTGRWKQLAARVNARYGYDIKRCGSVEDKGVPAEDVKPRNKVKYRFQCRQCGQIAERRRKSDFTENYTSYRCAKCGGYFKPI